MRSKSREVASSRRCFAIPDNSDADATPSSAKQRKRRRLDPAAGPRRPAPAAIAVVDRRHIALRRKPRQHPPPRSRIAWPIVANPAQPRVNRRTLRLIPDRAQARQHSEVTQQPVSSPDAAGHDPSASCVVCKKSASIVNANRSSADSAATAPTAPSAPSMSLPLGSQSPAENPIRHPDFALSRKKGRQIRRSVRVFDVRESIA